MPLKYSIICYNNNLAMMENSSIASLLESVRLVQAHSQRVRISLRSFPLKYHYVGRDGGRTLKRQGMIVPVKAGGLASSRVVPRKHPFVSVYGDERFFFRRINNAGSYQYHNREYA